MFKVGEKTVLLKPGEQADPGMIGITLRPCFPRYSFGYGSHIVTRTMVRKLENRDLTGKSVVDLGAGNGILSFLCKKLGATKVVSVDFDEQATEGFNRHKNDNAPDIEHKDIDITTMTEISEDIVLLTTGGDYFKQVYDACKPGALIMGIRDCLHKRLKWYVPLDLPGVISEKISNDLEYIEVTK